MARNEKSECADAVSDSNVLVLHEDLVTHSADLKAGLLELIGSDEEMVIDASAVQVVGTVALQLFSGFVNRANELQRSIRWDDCSAEFLQAVRLLGLRRHLGKAGLAGSSK